MPTLAIARPSALQVQPADLPRLPPCVVSRPALLQRLLASESRLRLLCAPAGTGKSVLLGQCARHTPAAVERVWLDLGGRSLTPTQLCKRLAAAMQLPFDDGGEAGLIDRLHERAGRLWIFIDDYPRQADDELDACLDRLFAAAPQQVTWWVACRRTPAWNLPRLLLQGDLLELKGEELALDDAALNELLAALPVTLAQDVRQALLDSSEGWLAAIRLLLLDVDEDALRQRLQAGCPLLRDYVQREVLADLDEELRSDLHALALLPRFSRSLCEHLLEGRGSELLGELQRRQLFVRSLDSSGTWFRLWRPLAEVLRLLPGAPASAPIHVRACQWFAQHGDIREAVEHALLAGQVEVAVNYLQRFSQEQLLQGHSVAQFLQWREELPAWQFASSPRLIVLQAWALIICARFDEAADCIQGLAHFMPQPDERRQRKLIAHWQALTGVLARQCGRRDARMHCEQALQMLDEGSWSQRVLCYQALAQQHMAEHALDQAKQALDQGLRLARLNGSLIFEALLNTDHCLLLDECQLAGHRSLACECRVSLAEALLMQDEVEQADNLLQQALGEARQLHLLRPLQELQQRQAQWLERLLPSEAGQSLHQRLFDPAPRLDEPASAGTALLSSRELAVLQLIAQGCSNQEIADRLFISLHTVKTHARRINVKLGVQRRTQAVAMAKAQGLMGD
jgi:ATP/maltotriose-dependent transcriptional regulator MalT